MFCKNEVGIRLILRWNFVRNQRIGAAPVPPTPKHVSLQRASVCRQIKRQRQRTKLRSYLILSQNAFVCAGINGQHAVPQLDIPFSGVSFVLLPSGRPETLTIETAGFTGGITRPRLATKPADLERQLYRN